MTLQRRSNGRATAPATAVRYLRAAAHLGYVMVERGAGLDDIDPAAFGEHLRTCRCPRAMGGRCNHHTIFGARLFRRHLVEIGVCRTAAVAAHPADPQLVAGFKVWLRKHRGASDSTIKLYARDATHLMAALGCSRLMLPRVQAHIGDHLGTRVQHIRTRQLGLHDASQGLTNAADAEQKIAFAGRNHCRLSVQ
jgi:hypothetical protein